MTTPAATQQPDPSSQSTRGQFIWHDYMAPDVAEAQAFYTAVFGWGIQEWPEFAYWMWTIDGEPRGGFAAFDDRLRSAGVPPHWMTYVAVADADATAAQAKALGARTVLPAEDIPDVGRFVAVQDPQGAWFQLFTPSGGADRGDVSPVGDVSWHELWTTDNEAAYAFYTTLFGWESAGEFADPSFGVYRMFGRNGVALGGMSPLLPAMKDVPPHWLPYFRVADLGAAIERVTANGGRIINGPMEVPGGDHIAQCLDPLGGSFALHQPAA